MASARSSALLVVTCVALVLLAVTTTTTPVCAQNGPGYIRDVGPHGQTHAAPLRPDERLFPQADGSLRDWRGHRVELDRTEIDPRTGRPVRERTSILGDAEDQRAQDLASRAEIERRRIEREERYGPPPARATAPLLSRAPGGGPLVCQGTGRCVTQHFCVVIAGGSLLSQASAFGVAGAACPSGLICCANVKWDKLKADAAAARLRRRTGTAGAAVTSPAATATATTPTRRTPPPIPADAVRRPSSAAAATTTSAARQTAPTAAAAARRESRGPNTCAMDMGRCVKRAFCSRMNGNEFGAFASRGSGCPSGLICCSGLDMAKIKADAAARRAQRTGARTAGRQ